MSRASRAQFASFFSRPETSSKYQFQRHVAGVLICSSHARDVRPVGCRKLRESWFANARTFALWFCDRHLPCRNQQRFKPSANHPKIRLTGGGNPVSETATSPCHTGPIDVILSTAISCVTSVP
jgi:hypothetical protein